MAELITAQDYETAKIVLQSLQNVSTNSAITPPKNDIVLAMLEARVDARSLSDFMYKPSSSMVSRRLAPSINTMNFYLDYFDGLKSIYTQAVGSVTVNGVPRKTIGQLEVDTVNAVGNAIEGVAIDANIVTDALTTIVPIATGANARTQLSKNRENTSILDFFTKAELAAYNASPTTFDAYRPIQAFFTHIAVNDVGVANVTIDAYIGTGIEMGYMGSSATRTVRGTMKLTALAPIDTMVMRDLGQEFEWIGSVVLYGHTSGGTLYTWANRTCRIGVDTHPTRNNARQRWGLIRCFGFQLAGLNIRGANTASSYGYARNNACGVGHYKTEVYRLVSGFSGRVDTGSSTSGSQRSVITVDYLPPENCIGALNAYVVINEETYIITAIDYTTKKLTVFPWLDLTLQTGSLSYVFGGGVCVTGKDSSSLTFGTIEGTNNGINLHDSALYGCTVQMLMSQACGFGFNIGASKGDANLGGVVQSYYAEGNHLDFVATTTAISNRIIVNSHTLQLSRVYAFSARILSSNTLLGATIGDIKISTSGTEYRGIKAPLNQANFPELNFLDPLKVNTVYSAKFQSIRLPDISKHHNEITGADSQTVKVIGTTKYNAPESVTFTLYGSTGLPNTSTVNGGFEDVVFRNFAEPPVFTVYAEIATKNYKVFLNTRVAISASLSFANLVPSASQTYPVVFDGVKTTDFLVARASKPLQGTTLDVSVTSSGNALVTHTNNTATAVNIGAVTLEIKSL